MRFSWVALATLLLTVPAAHAYDVDTHFYGTYAMARYAGIRHEVAAMIAAAAQWPDETTFMASPLLPTFLGTKERRLFHFPCYALSSGFSETTLKNDDGAFDDERKKVWAQHNTNCWTEPDHPMAYQIFWEGIREGDLLKAATTIHTVEDSYAHAGTPDSYGHTFWWHWPDRPYNRDGSIQSKYPRMVEKVFYVIVAFREVLRHQAPQALDPALRDPYAKSARPNVELSAPELARGYMGNPIVKQTVTRYILEDPGYTRPVMEWILTHAQRISTDPSTGNSRWWIEPSFDVRGWFRAQKPLQTMIDSGKYNVFKITEATVKALLVTEKEMYGVKGGMFSGHLVRYLLNRFEIGKSFFRFKDVPGIEDANREVSMYERALHNLVRFSLTDEEMARFSVKELSQIMDKHERKAAIKKIDQILELKYGHPPGTSEQAERLTMISEAITPFGKDGVTVWDIVQRKSFGLNTNRYRELKSRYDTLFTNRQRLQYQEFMEGLRGWLADPGVEPREDGAKGVDAFIGELVENILRGAVPFEADCEHRGEYEDDNAFPRIHEMNLRTLNVRKMIQRLFGTNIRFVGANESWYFPTARDPQQPLPARNTPDEIFVTLNYDQIDAWLDEIIRFTFPKVGEYVLGTGTAVSHFRVREADLNKGIKTVLKENLKRMSFKDMAALISFAHTIEKNWSAIVDDFQTTHLQASVVIRTQFRNPEWLENNINRTDTDRFYLEADELEALLHPEAHPDKDPLKLGTQPGLACDRTGILFGSGQRPPAVCSSQVFGIYQDPVTDRSHRRQ